MLKLSRSSKARRARLRPERLDSLAREAFPPAVSKAPPKLGARAARTDFTQRQLFRNATVRAEADQATGDRPARDAVGDTPKGSALEPADTSTRLARARQLGHDIRRVRTTVKPCLGVSRKTKDKSGATSAELLQILDTAVDSQGLSRGAGERVLSALATDPTIFAKASLAQLRRYVGAAVGAADPPRVDLLVDAAPPDTREVLQKQARGAFWFQSDLDSWGLEGLGKGSPKLGLRYVRFLQEKPYWQSGWVPAWAALDDRLRLAKAIQANLDRNPGVEPNERWDLEVALDGLERSARIAEKTPFAAIRNPLGAGGPEPPSTDLKGYQRALVTWVRLEIDPTLDPASPKAYDRARRLGWYHDPRRVLEHMVHGIGFDPAAAARIADQLETLSESQRLRFVGWLLGRGPEAKKLDFLRSLLASGGAAGGDANAAFVGPVQSAGDTLDQQEETRSFTDVFRTSAPPELASIETLPELLSVLDHWELTAQGYIETTVGLRRKQIEVEARQAKKGSGGLVGVYRKSFDLWQKGGPAYVRKFMSQIRQLRREARAAQGQLSGLKKEERKDQPDPQVVTGRVSAAHQLLEEARLIVSGLAPEARGFVEGIFSNDQQRNALAEKDAEPSSESSWLSRGLAGALQAVGKLVNKLKKPETWAAALEVGLEVGGMVFSGGASVLLKLAHWLVTTGAEMKTMATGMIEKISTLTSPGGFAKLIPIGKLFSPGALLSGIVGALFGHIPPEPQLGKGSLPGIDGGKKKTHGSGPMGKLMANVGRFVGTVRSSAQGLVSRVWDALASVDITRFPAFQTFATAYYRLTRFRRKVAGAGSAARLFVAKLRKKMETFFVSAETQIRSTLALFGNPAAAIDRWTRELSGAGIEYLIGLLITRPPSAILRTTFKAAAALLGTNTQEIAAKLRQALAGVPLIGEMIHKIEGTVAGSLKSVVEGPAKEIYSSGANVFETQALPKVEELQGQMTSTLSNAEKLVGQMSGGLWSSVPETAKGEPETAKGEPETAKKVEKGSLSADGRAQSKRHEGSARRKLVLAARPAPGETRSERGEARVARGLAPISRLVGPRGLGSTADRDTLRRSEISSDNLDPGLEKEIIDEETLAVKLDIETKKAGQEAAVQSILDKGQGVGDVVVFSGESLPSAVTALMKQIAEAFGASCKVSQVNILSPGKYAELGKHYQEAQSAKAFVAPGQRVFLEGEPIPKQKGGGVQMPAKLDADEIKILAHELIHTCSHKDFDEVFRYSPIEEGVVEYLARQLYPDGKKAYDLEVEAIETVIDKGLDGNAQPIRDAFFEGKFDVLDKTLEGSLGISFTNLGRGLTHLLRLKGAAKSWKPIRSALGDKSKVPAIQQSLDWAGYVSTLDRLLRGGKRLKFRRVIEDIFRQLGKPVDREDLLTAVERSVKLQYSLDRAKARRDVLFLDVNLGTESKSTAPKGESPPEADDPFASNAIEVRWVPDSSFDKLMSLQGGSAGVWKPLVYNHKKFETVRGFSFGPKFFALVPKRFFAKSKMEAQKTQGAIEEIEIKIQELQAILDQRKSDA